MLNKKSQESSVEFYRVLFADDIFKKLIGKAQNPAGSDASRILRFLDAATNLYNKSVLYAYFPRSTAKTVAIATKVAVRIV